MLCSTASFLFNALWLRTYSTPYVLRAPYKNFRPRVPSPTQPRICIHWRIVYKAPSAALYTLALCAQCAKCVECGIVHKYTKHQVLRMLQSILVHNATSAPYVLCAQVYFYTMLRPTCFVHFATLCTSILCALCTLLHCAQCTLVSLYTDSTPCARVHRPWGAGNARQNNDLPPSNGATIRCARRAWQGVFQRIPV